jgi:hypothetical protein
MTDSPRTSDANIPPPIGNLEQHSPASLLAAIERMRFTGELRFTVGQKTHAVDVRGGVASDEPEHARAMELFLSAVSGPYELREQLPVLPSGVRKNSLCVGGSLSDTSPAELLNFCESIGLTGKLSLDSEGRECLARYVKGELVSLTVDGQDDGALDAVFAWRAGSYQIQQRNAFDEEGPSSITDLRPALGTIEVALSEILARSAKNKGTAPITSLALPAKPKPKTIPPKGGVVSPDQSVKIIFRAPKLERDSKTAHASANVGREVVALDTATASGPLDEAKAEAIVAKARAAEAERERIERTAADRDESAAKALSSSKPAPHETEPAAPPSRALSAVIAATLVIALLVGLWSLVSMAGSAR